MWREGREREVKQEKVGVIEVRTRERETARAGWSVGSGGIDNVRSPGNNRGQGEEEEKGMKL